MKESLILVFMKYRFLIIIPVYALLSMTFSSCNEGEKCPEGINLLPMYGKVQKCKEQLESDKRFLDLSDKENPDRASATIKTIDNGWYYLHQGDYETAMKRINQAWLLDSTNILVYASFAVILDLTHKTDDAIKMLDLTFEKIHSMEEPEEPSRMNPGKKEFTEFVVSNAPFTYKKTNNAVIGKYLYAKLDSLDITEPDKAMLKNKLKTEIPDLP